MYARVCKVVLSCSYVLSSIQNSDFIAVKIKRNPLVVKWLQYTLSHFSYDNRKQYIVFRGLFLKSRKDNWDAS